MKYRLVVLLVLITTSLDAYKFDSGQYFLSGGVGAHVNVIRMTGAEASPKAYMPWSLTLDYKLDQALGIFAALAPQFGGSALSVLWQAGVKYHINLANAPYVPYLALAISPSFMLAQADHKNHFNLGLSPIFGLNYFVMANFLIGLDLGLHPSLAWANNERQAELAVSSLLNLSFKI